MQALNLMRYTHWDMIRFLLASLVKWRLKIHTNPKDIFSHTKWITPSFSGLRRQLRCLHPKFTTNANETEEPANKKQQSQQWPFYEVAELIDESEWPTRKTPVFILPRSLRQVAGRWWPPASFSEWIREANMRASDRQTRADHATHKKGWLPER